MLTPGVSGGRITIRPGNVLARTREFSARNRKVDTYSFEYRVSHLSLNSRTEPCKN
jgi:hypothetical protein